MKNDLTISEKISIGFRFIGEGSKDLALAVQNEMLRIIDYLETMNIYKRNLPEYKKADHIYNQTKSKIIKKKQLKKMKTILNPKYMSKGVKR